MSLFAELKRRNVLKVAIAYIVTSWLVAQVAQLAAESFGAPEWVMKMFITLLALGFPFAVIFAWAFEMTPEGIKKEKEIDRSQSITRVTGQKLNYTIIGLLALALGYFAYDKFLLTPATTVPVQVTETEEVRQDGLQTIAVLPFLNMSEDTSNEYFSDGLTEELLNILAKIKELRVAGRTSSFAFKGKNEDLRSIGEKLNVKSILEGSVRKDDKRNRVRITAQLIDVEDGYHLWSETYDRDLDDIFAIQEEIARKVAEALRVTLLGEDEVRLSAQTTTDLSAYDLYLRGLEQLNTYSFASLKVAISTFEQASKLDPVYVPARLKLAESWIESAFTGAVSQAEAIEVGRPILDSILEQDPTNSDAHVLSSRFYRFEREIDLAGKELSLAMDHNPRNVDALRGMGRMLLNAGNVQIGMEYLEESFRIDPYSVAVLWDLGMGAAFMLKPQETEKYARRIGELQPDSPNRYWGPGIAYLFAGNLVRSLDYQLKTVHMDVDDFEITANIASTWLDLGDLEQAEHWAKQADEIGADQPLPILSRIMIYGYREQHGLAGDLARRALDRKLDNRLGSSFFIRSAYISNLVRQQKITEALEYYRAEIPEAFDDSLQLDLQTPLRADQFLDIALLLQIGDPTSEQASELIDAAEQKMQLRDDSFLPWQRSLDRASVAAARGDKETALQQLHQAYERQLRMRWRERLTSSIAFNGLRNEPEYKRLVTLFETDMERQLALTQELREIIK